MKQKIYGLVKAFFLFQFLFLVSCKVNDKITPTGNGFNSYASVPTLTKYLSDILSVPSNEIVYNSHSKQFTVRQKIVMNEKQVQDNYRIANEYKLRTKQVGN